VETSPGSAPHVSAVMCTRNRADKIATAVKSVLDNDYPSFDVTIIDQSTSDDTRLAIQPLADSDPRLTYVHTDEPGLSRAYNNGIRRTQGEILVFTDDDCIAPPDWMASIVAAFEAEPDGDLLYGQVIAAGETFEDARLTPAIPIAAPERLSRRDGFHVFGMGANFAARRRLFDKAGGFDEILGGGAPLWSSQDFDMTYRTYVVGGVTLLRPEVVIRHDGRREEAEWPALFTAYGRGDGAFYMKHVRCRDPYITWLFARRVARTTLRHVYKKVRRRPTDTYYLRGVLEGARASFKFGVDRETRLYVAR
jgi:glycosyltransferase involved in cell wall biosynthesis